MKGEEKGLKQLNKYDTTTPKSPKLRKKSNKLLPPPKPKGRKKKEPTLLPGQQILTFKPRVQQKSEKQFKFFCYDEKTLHFQEEFSLKTITHRVDNDIDSSQYIVKNEVDKGVAQLVEEIAYKKFMQLQDTCGF